jgi:hypothetical protein
VCSPLRCFADSQIFLRLRQQTGKEIPSGHSTHSVGCVLTKLYFALNWILGALPVEPFLLSRHPYRNSPPTVSEPKGFQIKLPAV